MNTYLCFQCINNIPRNNKKFTLFNNQLPPIVKRIGTLQWKQKSKQNAKHSLKNRFHIYQLNLWSRQSIFNTRYRPHNKKLVTFQLKPNMVKKVSYAYKY